MKLTFKNSTHANLFKEFADYFDIKNIEDIEIEELYKILFEKSGVEGWEKIYDYMVNHSDFFAAPASARFHGNYDGGLAMHSLNVLVLLLKKNKDYEIGVTDSECIVSALCHDLCKCNFYTKTFKNQKVYLDAWQQGAKQDPGGYFVWKTAQSYGYDNKFPLGHGNKSLFILMNYCRVTTNVAMMIVWHMGPYANTSDDSYGYNNAVEYCPAVQIMHTADLEAASLFETVQEDVFLD